ncbi:MAG TPA: hypothetical protein VER96_24380 [Polyangiaceae bacterium]|nr:hypothetical protein [Polyangiaceae bacterium]
MFNRLSVGVATQLISEVTIAEVAEACRRIDVETTFGTLEQLELCGADILIAGLRAGRRLVPDEYLSFLSRRSVEASLMLICQEALVRPCVSLSQGRVTLVGPDPDAETIYNRLRVLLAERASPHGSGAERAAPTWWVADSPCFGRTTPACGDEHGSLTLAFELGGETGVLRFAPAEQEWLVCWPPVPGTLWLLSPLRLPPISDLSGSHGGRGNTRLPAASGDIAIALSVPARDDSTSELVRGLTAKATFGGPSVFDAVSASLRKDAWVSVVEVR